MCGMILTENPLNTSRRPQTSNKGEKIFTELVRTKGKENRERERKTGKEPALLGGVCERE